MPHYMYTIAPKTTMLYFLLDQGDTQAYAILLLSTCPGNSVFAYFVFVFVFVFVCFAFFMFFMGVSIKHC